jgi:hypothetical protein
MLFVYGLFNSAPCSSDCIGSEVLTALAVKNTIFWYIAPCSPLKVNLRFGGTYHPHLHGRRINLARKVAICFHAGFFLGLSFDPEDGGDMFLRNVV